MEIDNEMYHILKKIEACIEVLMDSSCYIPGSKGTRWIVGDKSYEALKRAIDKFKKIDERKKDERQSS